MKNYIKIGLLTVLPGLLMAQGGIRNQGATISVSSDAQLKIVHGGMLHQDNGLILNDGEIQVSNDWIQQGEQSQYSGRGTLAFVGNTDQQLSSNLPLVVANLNINNGHRLVLNSELQIRQQLDLQNNGTLELGTHNLFLDSDAAIRNYDETHYVLTNNTGFLQQEIAADLVLFPVGNESYNPAFISNKGTIDHFRVRVLDQTAETETAVNRTWWIEEAIQGGSLANLTLLWDEAQELANFDRNLSTINDGLNTNLTNYTAASLNGMQWSQTRSNLTDLTSFTVTSQTTTALPQAKMEGGQQIQVFPNPTNDYLNIRLGEKVETAFIQIFDSKGSLVLQEQKTIGNQQIIQVKNLQRLVEGIYSIQITTDDQTTSHKFIKG